MENRVWLGQFIDLWSRSWKRSRCVERWEEGHDSIHHGHGESPWVRVRKHPVGLRPLGLGGVQWDG